MTSDPVGAYFKLEEAAQYYAHEAFRFAHVALEHEVAGLLFGELINRIDPPPGWVPPILPQPLPEMIASDIDVLPDETIREMAYAWQAAQVSAPSKPRRIGHRDTLQSVDLAGHAIMLAAAIECSVNRELLLRKEEGHLSEELFSQLDRARVLLKIHFLLSQERESQPLNTGPIGKLFKMRNAAVHLSAGTAASIETTPQELIQIWKAVASFLEIVRGRPSREDLESYHKEIMRRWFE